MNRPKMPAALFISVTLLLFTVTTFAARQHAQAPRPDQASREIEKVVRQFWDGLGRLDAESIKQTVDWPVTIIEVARTGSRASLVLRNPAEFDEEFKRTPAATVERRKGEFFGTTLTSFKVQMLGADLASVTYLYRLPRDLAVKHPISNSGSGNGLTFLRRDSRQGNSWKIVFTTVPR